MNQSSAEAAAPPMTNYADTYFGDAPNFECFIRSQALSHHSERQLDKVVNRLFEDAGRKKIKMEKLRMES